MNTPATSRYCKRKAKKYLKEIEIEMKVKKIITNKSVIDNSDSYSISNLAAWNSECSEDTENLPPQSTYEEATSPEKCVGSEIEFNKFDEDYKHSDSTDTDFYDEFSEGFSSTDSEEISSSTEGNVDSSLSEKLRNWAIRYKISLTALTALLVLLTSHIADLPRDGRTLLHTARKTFIQPLSNCSEQFWYCGFSKAFEKVDLIKLWPSKILNLIINIDGIPLFKSSNWQFWPILCKIENSDFLVPPPMLIGCFCGKSKPKSVHSFLEEFVNDLQNLLLKGFYQNNNLFTVKIKAFVCDAPARAFVKGIKTHSGYYSCERCIQKGHHVLRRVIFPDLNAAARTDYSVSNMSQPEHHKYQSPLTDLGVKPISQFPLDSMHLLYLGVTRKLLLLMMRVGKRRARISQQQISKISSDMDSFAEITPKEFNRKPRSLYEIDRWKATEFRSFLLYFGPVVLQKILPKEQYKHFLALHIASSIMSNTELSTVSDHVKYAESLLFYFVKNMKAIYGSETLTYNIHSLLHLSDDVRRFGNLDAVSCFPFENYLGYLKSLIRSPYKPLAQLIKRLSEQTQQKEINIKNIQLEHQHSSGPSVNVVGIGYKTIKFNHSVININSKSDKYVYLKNGRIAKVLNIKSSEDIFLICQNIIIKGDLYSSPCSSQLLGIFKIGITEKTIFNINLLDVKNKCICNEKDSFAIVLNHTFFSPNTN